MNQINRQPILPPIRVDDIADDVISDETRVRLADADRALLQQTSEDVGMHLLLGTVLEQDPQLEQRVWRGIQRHINQGLEQADEHITESQFAQMTSGVEDADQTAATNYGRKASPKRPLKLISWIVISSLLVGVSALWWRSVALPMPLVISNAEEGVLSQEFAWEIPCRWWITRKRCGLHHYPH